MLTKSRKAADPQQVRSASNASPGEPVAKKIEAVVFHGERRLCVIAFADVVDWTSLVSADDEATMSRWSSLRSEVIGPLAASFRGELIDVLGDAVVLTFGSAVAAVEWAMQLQDRLAAVRAGSPNALRMRVAISADDCLVDGDRLIANGLNIASRLQALAEADQVLVTKLVAEIVEGKSAYNFVDLGARFIKNVDRPIHAFAVESVRPASTPNETNHRHLDWATRARIAVLPMRQMGVDGYDAIVGDGLVEEIVAKLSRSRSFLVIARNSTTRYADTSLSMGQISTQLDARYLLCGSIRRMGDLLRISVELIDASMGRLVWAERFDGSVLDVFGFQDRIASGICAALEPKVESAESIRIAGKPAPSLSAYDCVLRGQSQLYQLDDDSFESCRQYFQRALVIDNGYARAHAYMAWWHNLVIGEGRSSHPDVDTASAVHHAALATRLDNQDAFALAVQGHVTGFLERRLPVARTLFDSAILANDSSAFAWGISASTWCFSGDYLEALKRIVTARRLSPFDPLEFWWSAVEGIANFGLGEYSTAVETAQTAVSRHNRFLPAHRVLCSGLAQLGEIKRAQHAAQALLQHDPDFRVDVFCRWYPLPDPALSELRQGLLMAGLPA